MNKKALELSINFIVMLILTILVFSLGIVFITKLFGVADDAVAQFDEQTEREIDNALARGESVAIPSNYKEINVRKTEAFGLGLMNQFNEEKEFKIFINYDTSVPVTEQNTADWTFPESSIFTIKNNNQEKIPLIFTVPSGTKPGMYIFNVYVCYKGDPVNSNTNCLEDYSNLYDIAPQIRIKVP